MPGILIVDDHAVIRTCVRSLLDAHSIPICGEAQDGETAIEKAFALRPDIVLLDISMPTMDGLAVAQELRRTLPSTRIVFLTAYDSDYLVAKSRLWSHGFVSKAKAATALVPMVKRLLEAEFNLRYPWQRVVMDAFASPRDLLLVRINVAERAIASRLRQQIEPDERIALKEALRALQQLISETTPSEAEDKSKGVA